MHYVPDTTGGVFIIIITLYEKTIRENYIIEMIIGNKEDDKTNSKYVNINTVSRRKKVEKLTPPSCLDNQNSSKNFSIIVRSKAENFLFCCTSTALIC